jgi:2-polyprenyl-3-methyl-5-hydroxy-6-metoxy-1,4-benzoquinol methylase
MSTSRYDSTVNPDGHNNAHSYALRMVGWNQRVLELGAANGSMTRALANWNNKVTAVEYDPDAAVHLKECAESVVIGDLNNPETLAAITGPFDVVLAGDVLEHLLDPERVLLQVVEKLAPGGKVVISLPNIAHADVRMSLLKGRFDYNPVGLLDATHIKFFTLKTIREFVGRAGLVIVDMQRVRVPAFETELRVNRADVPTAVVNEVLADPEAETYQFVFTAVRDDGSDQLASIADKYLALKAEHERLQFEHKALKRSHREVRQRANDFKQQARRSQAELTKLKRSKVLRYSAPARAVIGKLRAVAR